ncbi:MAG: F0F1 ATP synthase subunit delta [Oscillatoriales cyanobacterium SM2_2_1]|nr:F0F1 ATP synthase subunit delta [Oscillatoriales cyanobacterium SM2_2_1]
MKATSARQAVTDPYAEALLNLAQQQQLLDQVGEDVQVVLTALADSAELRQLLSVPLVRSADKIQIIQSLFGSRLQPLTVNFLCLLVDKGRIIFAEAICRQFQNLLRNLRQIAYAEVSSAHALSDQQQETLRQRILTLTGAQQVELAIRVDPELIGGVIVKVGSQVVDASIRGQLRRISSRLMANL